MFHYQSYNVASHNIVVGMLSIGVMVVIREFDTIILGMLLLVIDALYYIVVIEITKKYGVLFSQLSFC